MGMISSFLTLGKTVRSMKNGVNVVMDVVEDNPSPLLG